MKDLFSNWKSSHNKAEAAFDFNRLIKSKCLPCLLLYPIINTSQCVSIIFSYGHCWEATVFSEPTKKFSSGQTRVFSTVMMGHWWGPNPTGARRVKKSFYIVCRVDLASIFEGLCGVGIVFWQPICHFKFNRKLFKNIFVSVTWNHLGLTLHSSCYNRWFRIR